MLLKSGNGWYSDPPRFNSVKPVSALNDAGIEPRIVSSWYGSCRLVTVELSDGQSTPVHVLRSRHTDESAAHGPT